MLLFFLCCCFHIMSRFKNVCVMCMCRVWCVCVCCELSPSAGSSSRTVLTVWMWSVAARRRTAARFPPGSASWSHCTPDPDTWRCGSDRSSSPPRPQTRARAPPRAPAARARNRTDPWRYRRNSSASFHRSSDAVSCQSEKVR